MERRNVHTNLQLFFKHQSDRWFDLWCSRVLSDPGTPSIFVLNEVHIPTLGEWGVNMYFGSQKKKKRLLLYLLLHCPDHAKDVVHYLQRKKELF